MSLNVKYNLNSFVIATDQVLNLKTFAQLEKDLILIAYDGNHAFY